MALQKPASAAKCGANSGPMTWQPPWRSATRDRLPGAALELAIRREACILVLAILDVLGGRASENGARVHFSFRQWP